jgi:predicted PolB exonuclease-like 3'-5' exonuclease
MMGDVSERAERGYLVFDLETVVDGTLYDPPEPKEGEERPFAPLFAQRPITVGALWLSVDLGVRRLWTIDGFSEADERGLLTTLSDFVDEHRPTLVTFNGRGFDLPVLVLRSLRHGVAMPWYFEEERYRDRRAEEGHLDLHDALALHGAARRSVSLDVASRLLGLPGKVGVDGSQVEPLYHAGKWEEIRRYCLGDVAQTAFLLVRYLRLRGELTLDEHREAASGLLSALRDDGRVQELLALIPSTWLVDSPGFPSPAKSL